MIIMKGPFSSKICSDFFQITDCMGTPIDISSYLHDPVHFIHLSVKHSDDGLSINHYNSVYTLGTWHTARNNNGDNSFEYAVGISDASIGKIAMVLNTEPGYIEMANYKPKIEISLGVKANASGVDRIHFADRIKVKPIYLSFYNEYDGTTNQLPQGLSDGII